MLSRCRTRAFAAVVCAAALTSAGCLNPYLNPFPAHPPYPPADKSADPPVDNRPANSVTRAQYQPPASTPLHPPAPVPQTPAQALPPPRDMTGGNPHQRVTPTNTGQIGALGPNELPLDRMLDLARRIDELVEENKKLQARIGTLEAIGLSREQALNEALREVDRATDGVTKARADLQALRAEIAALREKLKKVEKDELETLNTVIQALQQLLDDK